MKYLTFCQVLNDDSRWIQKLGLEVGVFGKEKLMKIFHIVGVKCIYIILLNCKRNQNDEFFNKKATSLPLSTINFTITEKETEQKLNFIKQQKNH